MMSMNSPTSKGNADATGRFGPDGRDRRRRRRVKMAMPVHIWGGVGSTNAFEDVGKTIDASRDGLLVATERSDYWLGQSLEVRLGCGAEPMPVGSAQRARVVRSTPMPNSLSYAIALEFEKLRGVDAGGQVVSPVAAVTGGVLLVESDPRMASLTRDLLQKDGYRVVQATTGAEALEILLTATPDVLLAGMEDGEITGQELCSIVKKSSRLNHIPVILLTRAGQPSDYSACHQEGAVLCMAMPCPPSKLQQAVRMVSPPPGSDMFYSQLRKTPRYTVAAAVDMTDGKSAVRHSGRVAEISRKGCYVDVMNTLPVGTLRKMQISRDSGTFMAKGKVIYVHERIGMGVAFVDPPPDQLKVLDSWLAECAAASL